MNTDMYRIRVIRLTGQVNKYYMDVSFSSVQFSSVTELNRIVNHELGT